MITSEVAIYNLALNAIGARNNVTSPDERSREAEVCRLWYSPVRDQALAAAPWPGATKFQRLPLLTSQNDGVWIPGEPRPGFGNLFALPIDCLRPQYLSDYDRFLITSGDDGLSCLSTNSPQPILFYTYRQTTIQSWSSELQMAIVYALAAHICMPLSGKTQRTNLMLKQANELIYAARESAANVSTEQFETVPDWIAGRGYNFQSQPRYIHPWGASFMVGNVN